ncbi:hypothetical protein KTR10_00190 [Candidatus Kaiserbacteria bacterium]|nr:hypothetical protein [Candidatus Kaiserbacteria bacterium]
MEVITLNGREYIKASKAAREVGYTSDYVGQLCRSGAITAERVGRNWYVDREELREHKTDKKRNARSKAREHVRRIVREEATATEHASIEKQEEKFEPRYLAHASDTRYVSDRSPLIPEIKKTPKNKDFSVHIVKDAPEIKIKKITSSEAVSSKEKPTKVPLKISSERNTKKSPSKMRSVRQDNSPPSVQGEDLSWDKSLHDVQEGSPTSSPIRSGVVLLITMFIAFLVLGMSSESSVQISTSTGSVLNQFTSGYTLDFSLIISNIAL